MYSFTGHDFGPGVSVLTTELLHHVCLAVYAVNNFILAQLMTDYVHLEAQLALCLCLIEKLL